MEPAEPIEAVDVVGNGLEWLKHICERGEPVEMAEAVGAA